MSEIPRRDVTTVDSGSVAAPVPYDDPHLRVARPRAASAPTREWYAHVVVPVVLFLLLAGGTVWLWRAQVTHEWRDIRDDTALIAPAAADRFEFIVRDELRPLGRFARELGNGSIADAQRFLDSVAAVRIVVPSLKTVAWVDLDGQVIAVSPPEHAIELPLDQPLSYAEPWGKAFKNAYAFARRNTVVAGRHAGVPAQWVCLPFQGHEAAQVGGERPQGAVMARVSFGERAVTEFHVPAWRDFHLSVRDADDNVVYASSETAARAAAPGTEADRCAAEQSMRINDAAWTMRLEPTPQFIADRHGSAGRLVLAAGLSTAVLASALSAQGLLHRRRERRRADGHLAALEALAKVSAAISTAPPAPADLLAQLAGVAARLMHMSMSSVSLYDAQQRAMRVVFRDNLPNPDGRDVYAIEETPCSADCMRTRRPVAFEDVEAPGSPFPPGHMRRFGIRSLILVPLIVSDRAVGVLMLCHETVRRYTALDARLVELWMTQASAILSNRRLYEDMTAAIENERQILNQRAKLYEVNTRIQFAPSLRDAMRLVAELAPQALEVNACVVCLAHPNRGHVHVAAITPGQATGDLREDFVAECATCAGVIEDGGARRVEDLRDHPVRGFPHMGSALFVPLASGGATLGLLVLLRIARGPFTAEQVRVAELFAARAAAAIERNRLLEETRRQADTNAVLLRELNHRVGNNFASIIGLLKVASRGLPVGARAPIDRAVERVHMMSRAHELFSGGVRSVPLADLVQTTIASVPSLGGAESHVDVCVELHDPGARLFSTRAITLAMVLHELAYNAMEYALGAAGGELLVRSRAVGADRIAVEVIDRAAIPVAVPVGPEGDYADANGSESGNGIGTESGSGTGHGHVHRAAHAGIGLELVRSLVARELCGRFALTRSEIGTTATVEFPLEPQQEVECHP